MDVVATAYDRLMKLESHELEELMAACSGAHATMCAAAGEDIDPHANQGAIRSRVSEMSKESLARALAPFAALGEIAHEHHPGHGTH